MRKYICSAILMAASASIASAGPVLSAGTADESGGAPGLSGLSAGTGGVELGFGTDVDEAVGNAVLGGGVSVGDVGEIVSPPPVLPELIGTPAPVNPPGVIGGIVEFGGASGGGSGAPASVTAVPLPLAAYGGLVLMLLPVGRGVWRRAKLTSAGS